MNISSDKKKRYGKIIAAALPVIIITFILRLPFYYTVLFYFAVFLVSVVIYFSNYLAVWANFNYARGNEERARRLFVTAIRRKTTSPAAHLNYAILLMRDGDAEAALELLDKALTLKPKVIAEKNIRLAMGSCRWVMKDIDGAVGVLEDMRTRYEYVNSHVLTTLGYMYYLKNETEKALELTESAIQDSPEYAAAWDNLGQIRLSLGEAAAAKEAFDKAVSFKPDLADSNYYLGLIAEAENDAEAAAEYFKKTSECKVTALNTVTAEQIAEKLGGR